MADLIPHAQVMLPQRCRLGDRRRGAECGLEGRADFSSISVRDGQLEVIFQQRFPLSAASWSDSRDDSSKKR